jgi:glycosyltransferase involved in cell wall biosynthesis
MTDTKPKILILTHCFPSDTSDIPGNFLFDLCEDLVSRGAEVSVITQKMNRNADPDFIKRSGAEMIYFPWRGGGERFSDIKFSSAKSLLSVISLLYNGRRAFKNMIRSSEYDLVISCWLVPAGLWSLSLTSKKHHAVWALGSDVSIYSKIFFNRQLLKLIISKNGTVFTNSINHQKIIKNVLNSGSELLYTSRLLPAPRTVYKKTEKLKFVFIGRLEKVKGPDILLSAIKMSGIKDFEIKFIGNGSMMTNLVESVKSDGLEEKIIFLGEKDSTIISDELTSADYLVISSRSESMPVVFWEAMQTSTPVLSTEAGDIGYYCEKYNVGRVCQADEKSLSELLKFADEFRPMRDSMASNTSKVRELSSIKNSAGILYKKAENFSKERLK